MHLFGFTLILYFQQTFNFTKLNEKYQSFLLFCFQTVCFKNSTQQLPSRINQISTTCPFLMKRKKENARKRYLIGTLTCKKSNLRVNFHIKYGVFSCNCCCCFHVYHVFLSSNIWSKSKRFHHGSHHQITKRHDVGETRNQPTGEARSPGRWERREDCQRFFTFISKI